MTTVMCIYFFGILVPGILKSLSTCNAAGQMSIAGSGSVRLVTKGQNHPRYKDMDSAAVPRLTVRRGTIS